MERDDQSTWKSSLSCSDTEAHTQFQPGQKRGREDDHPGSSPGENYRKFYRERNKIHARNCRRRKQERVQSMKEEQQSLTEERDRLWQKLQTQFGILYTFQEWQNEKQLRPPHVRTEQEILQEVRAAFAQDMANVPPETEAKSEDEKKYVWYVL
eukprot:gb/GECG01009434.1/.p1 GENE.gb/GECG01009434.1/~~gb/GECG01009434.1/.p1  ORF type:complete len:154 (+),score=30.35 gb/GECG01009434.1/:1-462(+)